MARQAPSEYPLPPLTYERDFTTSPHMQAFEELRQASAALPEGEIVGALVRWQRADGYAYYLVTSASPLTLQHVPFGDAYRVESALIRGLREADVRAMVASERRLNALFKR